MLYYFKNKIARGAVTIPIIMDLLHLLSKHNVVDMALKYSTHLSLHTKCSHVIKLEII